MHGGCRAGFGRAVLACLVSILAAGTRLDLVTLDPSTSARLASRCDPASCRGYPPLFSPRGIVLVVLSMPFQQISAPKSFLADIANKALSEGVSGYMPLYV